MLAMEKHFQEIDQDEWTTLWVIPVTKLLKSCRHCAVACQRIIVRAFQLYPAILKIIFPRDYLGNSQESAVLIKCLQYARHNGVEVSINKKESAIYWRGLIDKDKLEKFMTHQNEEIRAAALASIIESQKTTEVFLDWEFEYLRKYLRYNITSPTPSFRKQIIAYYKKALTRYNAGFYVIVRNVAYLGKRLETMQDRQDVVRAHKFYQGLKGAYKAFIQKFTKQLIANLTFDSNYWRRATTLELLLTVDRFMSMEEWHACWTEDDVKNCHGMLFDCFETNKKMALQLLKNLPPASMGFTNVEFTFKYMQRCLNMALDIKPSKTLSAAYLLQICACSPNFYDIVQYGGQRQLHNSTLDMLIVLTGKLISESTIKVDIANTKTAHYGIILSIRHLLEHRDINKNNDAYSGLFEHLVTICLNLKEDIMPVVCNPSPEGYLPDPGDELCAADDSARAQSVLLYAWRTMKEMTLLLAEIARQTIKLEGTVEMLSEDLLVKIGQLFVDIFVQSKHRGVFEHAYNGFYVICESFWISTNPNINALPKTWLREAIYLCTGQKQSDQLCATRRSAGLPFLILFESPLNKPYFNESIKTILDVCDNLDPSNNECRIHSMNVLRYMFRHSRLGELIVPHIGVGVKAAIVGFKSDTWGNSATLLYAALVTRMFGVQRTHDCEDLPLKNRLTIRVFFMRFPELSQFLLSTLKEECDKCDSLTLHPVLMILSRLYPANLEEYNTQELAAKASISFIHNFDVLKRLENCFDRIGQPDIKDNECHGLLTQVWCLLKTGTKLPEVPLTSYFYNSIYLLQQVGRKFSHHTVSLYMEVIMLLLSKFRKYDDLDMLKGILTLLSRQIASNLLPVTAVSRFPQTRLLLVLYIAVNKFEECDATYPTITNQIMSFLYGHDSEMKRFCLYLLIAMNHTQNDAATKHPLFVTEEMQIPQQIQALMDTFDKGSVTRIPYAHPPCFLTEELKFQHYIKREDQVLFFLLVIYYPCVIKYLNLSKQETLNLLIKYCDCDNEELISAVVGCISTFLLQLDYNVLRYDKLVPVLAESASPAASEYRRLAVCDFLVKNYILYCNEERILSADDLQMILNIVMVLLEDDDLTVRNAMSDFATTLKVRIMLNDTPKQTISSQRWPVIPEKAREDLLHLSTKIMPKDSAVCFLFSWACRHFPDVSNDASEVFQRGELNMYAENVAFIDLCACLLYNLLWPLEDGLNYADNSIFIEEQTLIVTTVLLDSLLKNPSPMMLYKTKVSVICALKSTLSSTFSSEFRVYLEETILGYLTKHVEHVDLFSVKRIMRNIYEPVLNYRVPRT
ncbi:hypothetical protein NQ318_019941 [Aromia moschata]|uniref:tRNA (32-2'-O)-methyltransferase regulator THADA n=1 Tax=Aromia moschata TaxID=1265417 RepID=A0AAV8Y6L8_9CUCU|nr:hypothetical protein NQ318_019941 [Aromia moschata]